MRRCVRPVSPCQWPPSWLRFRTARSAEIVEQVLVKLNGEIITKTEFEGRQLAELRNRPELANRGHSILDVMSARARTNAFSRRTHPPDD
jgi:hypothetical protein